MSKLSEKDDVFNSEERKDAIDIPKVNQTDKYNKIG